ncbi:MAG: divalent metal cation transporter, partial [Planctomycetales bacterium]|nr:divalent metal cation transporter [Planctomycetales bacterium]
DVAAQLQPLFGPWGTLVFCVGLFSAAYSSFIVNALIGGFLLADGLGLGDRPTDTMPRVFAVAVMLIGMTLAMWIIRDKWDPVPAIVAAQAVTVVASPLLAAALLWLSNSRDVVGDARNHWATNLAAAAGLALLLGLAWHTAFNVLPARWESMWQEPPAAAAPAQPPA